jgi:hypothetical protein
MMRLNASQRAVGLADVVARGARIFSPNVLVLAVFLICDILVNL